MDAYPDVDDREFGPERDVCPDCEADLIDDGHTPGCSWHPNYFEPDARDEHDTPIDEEDAA